jgi:Fe(3+) dicitrate transport protein
VQQHGNLQTTVKPPRARSIGVLALGAGVHLAVFSCAHLAAADEPALPPPAEAGAKPAEAASQTADAGAKAAEAEARNADAEAKATDSKTIEVRVIGGSADALQKIPGSGQVIGAKEVARAAPLDVSELLRRVPGLQVRQEEGGGLRLDISVRGLDGTRSRRVLVLEDGVPVAINPYGEPDLYYSTPVERIRGIEVVKGSGSILFGPQTIGGVVQFLTHAPPESRRLFVAMEGGAPGQFELLGRYGDAWGDVRYMAQIFGKRGDGARGEDYYATDAFAKVAVPTSARSEITAKVGFHNEAANSTDVGMTQGMFEAEPRRPTIAPFDQVSLQHIDGSVVHRLWLGEGTELKTLAYVTTTSRLWRRQDYDRVPVLGVTYERIVGDVTKPLGAIYFRTTDTIRDRSYGVFGVEPRLTHHFVTGGVQHTLDVGARVLAETAHRAQRAGESPLSLAGALMSDEDHSTLALSGYAQDRIAFSDHLLVTPGFRFEFASFTRSIHRVVIHGVAQDVSVEGASSVAEPIPGIGLVVGTPQIHGFGGFHIGFAPPRVTTAITGNGGDELNAQQLKDEQLQAERALHYEAGLRVAPWRFLRAEATLFLSNFQNQIIPVTNAGSATTELVNGGKTRHIGVEGAVRFEAGRAFHWPLTVDVYAGYTGLMATFDGGPLSPSNGHALPYSPAHTVSAVLDVEHPFGFGAQASWTFVGPQFSDDTNTRAIDVTGRIGEIPEHHVLDVTLRYTHKATGLGGSLAVKNLTDDIYVASRRPDGIFPGGFRQIVGSVRWAYDEGAP